MKLGSSAKTHAFTLSEMIIAIAIATIILAVTLTSSIALQRSFNEVDNYFTTHMQQIRIVDYLARDVRRGLSVTSSVDRQTVLITIPKYIIQGPSPGYAGDPEAIADPSKIGTPRLPRREIVNRDLNVNYVPLTGFSAGLTTATVEYKVQGSSILRTEYFDYPRDPLVTTIASSTDNLIPDTTDTELANTEYTTTAVTFEPISVADRNSTVVYSTAYMRNRRRPPPL